MLLLTEEVGWSSNASDLYLGGAWFKYWLGMDYPCTLFIIFQCGNSDETTNTSFHILSNLLYTS
jgi:hypothetical protein